MHALLSADNKLTYNVYISGASVSSTMGGSAMAFETEDRRREEEETELGFTPEDAKE